MDLIVRSRTEWLSVLNGLDPAVGMILAVAGLVFVLIGWRVYQAIIVINIAALGALGGSIVGGLMFQDSWVMQVVCAVAGAVVLGGMAVPMFKVATVLCASLIGGYLGAVVSSGFSASGDVHLAGGLVGMGVAASLVFIVFEHLMITVISFQGALMTVAGVLAASNQQASWLRHFRDMASRSDFMIVFTVFALTVIGICVQLAGMREGAGAQTSRQQ